MTDPVVYVNTERTIGVRVWESGNMEVILRPHPDAIWAAPVYMYPEGTGYVLPVTVHG
jgi:hypothetical protein